MYQCITVYEIVVLNSEYLASYITIFLKSFISEFRRGSMRKGSIEVNELQSSEGMAGRWNYGSKKLVELSFLTLSFEKGSNPRQGRLLTLKPPPDIPSRSISTASTSIIPQLLCLYSAKTIYLELPTELFNASQKNFVVKCSYIHPFPPFRSSPCESVLISFENEFFGLYSIVLKSKIVPCGFDVYCNVVQLIV